MLAAFPGESLAWLERASRLIPPYSAMPTCVDGISIRQPWRELEKSPGVFDWSYLDSEVRRAADADKVVLLRILSEGPGTPSWIFEKGVQTLSYENQNRFQEGGSGRIAVYWDPTDRAQKKGDDCGGGGAFRGQFCGPSSRGDLRQFTQRGLGGSAQPS